MYSAEISASGDVVIPKKVFADDFQLYALRIYETPEEPAGGYAAASQATDYWVNEFITRKFDRSDPNNYFIKMVISIGSEDLQITRNQNMD